MPFQNNEQRQESRTSSQLAAQISIGTQITLKGRLKDLSLKSAFIVIKESVFIEANDELTFMFGETLENVDECIQGTARVSRLVKGEGFAIYFTKMDEDSIGRLKKIVRELEKNPVK